MSRQSLMLLPSATTKQKSTHELQDTMITHCQEGFEISQTRRQLVLGLAGNVRNAAPCK